MSGAGERNKALTIEERFKLARTLKAGMSLSPQATADVCLIIAERDLLRQTHKDLERQQSKIRADHRDIKNLIESARADIAEAQEHIGGRAWSLGYWIGFSAGKVILGMLIALGVLVVLLAASELAQSRLAVPFLWLSGGLE